MVTRVKPETHLHSLWVKKIVGRVFSGWLRKAESIPEDACLSVCLSSQDAKFVEERRKQLQTYLRSVMNKVIQAVPEFTASPQKETLTQLMPFFV